MHFANSAPTGLTDYITVFGDVTPDKKVGFLFELDAFESYFQFNATAASKTYTFPDATGTVALINASNILSVPKDGSTSGALALGGGTTGTITLQAPASVTGTGTYTLPSAYPAAASGYYLTSNLSGALNWVAVTGGGDVVGPSISTDGNFAVFDSTTGKIIKESVAASLSAAGAAVFNSSVTLGVSASTTGQLVFRNATTSATTTFQSSLSQSANLNYTWPQSAPTAGQVLSSDASGNLSWTATGTGNVTLAGTNAFTGTNSFASTVTITNAGTFNLTTPSSSGITRLVSSATVGVTNTFTFPNITTATVAVSNNSQTFTGTQTFNGPVVIQGNLGLGTFTIGTPSGSGATTFVSNATVGVTNTFTFPNITTATVAVSNNSQTFTGTQSFNGPVVIQGNGGSGTFTIGTPIGSGTSAFVSTATVGANQVFTLPNATGILPLLSLAQTFSALQTFSAGLTVSAGTTTISGAATFSNTAGFSGAVTISAAGTSTTSPLNLTSGTYPYLLWNTVTQSNTPKFTTRSIGTRLVMLNSISSSTVDYAIGVDSLVTWISVSVNTARVSFYGGETEFGYFTGTGLTLPVSGTSTSGQINIIPGAAGVSNYQYINFGQYNNQRAAPDMTTRSVGTRMVLFNAVGGGALADYAIGVNTNDIWIGTASTSQTISMYAGATRVAWFSGTANVGLTFADGYNIVFNATTGTKIATSTTQKLAFWNKTPIVQPTTAITGATRVGGVGTPVTTTDTYGGYTLAQIAAALVNTGILA
jgi:hypothetical protein